MLAYPFVQYFDRACWAHHHANNDKLPPIVRSHFSAIAVHACQSLLESLHQLAEEGHSTNLREALKGLPHTQLIESIRNMDLHGWPLPICDPNIQMATVVSKPGQPIRLSSSHGVEVTMQMKGLGPTITRYPKDLKHGKVDLGKPVSYGCVEGKMIVHEFSTGKDYYLLEALRAFLVQAKTIVDGLAQPPPQDPTP